MGDQVDSATSPEEAGNEGRPGRLKHWGQALFGSGLLSGVVALIAAAISIWSQIEARRAADRATELKVQADEAQLAFQRYRGERGDQLVIYDRVEKQLGIREPHALVISSSYAQLVEDPKVREVLCQTILAVAKDRVESSEDALRPRFAAALGNASQLLKDCIIEAIEEQRIDPQGNLAGQPATAAAGGGSVVQAQAPVTKVVSSAVASPDGWDIDVFRCDSQGEKSAQLAARAANHLARASDRGRRIGGQRLGRIRLRSLSAAAQSKLAPPSNVPVVVGSADEAELAQAIAADVNQATDIDFKYSYTAAISQWYISLFACGFGQAS